jgi:DNA processing protein
MQPEDQARPSDESGSARTSIDRMSLHLAGCSARDELQLHCAPAVGPNWRGAASDAWRAAGLSAWKCQCLETLRDGRVAEAELQRCSSMGLRLVEHDHADYPRSLHHLYAPPLLLAVRGRWPIEPPAVAVVGARAATAYGRQSTRVLSAALARAGFAIVSGLARGVDRFALEATLEEGGWPVAVLGNGIDIAYPPENRELQAAIGREGTLLSEFPLGRRPDRIAFPRRNRVIAALARQVLVVEAGLRSGALITVAHACELGLDVLAVPGPIDSDQSAGCNALIADGATPIVDIGALMFAVRGPMPALDSGGPTHSDPLLAVLGRRTLDVDELAQASGRSSGSVMSGLVALELQGLVQRLPGGRFAARTPHAPQRAQR